MVRSMTGYGRVQQVVDGYSILVEIKSVNHRFFDFTARVPRMYGYLEEKLKSLLQSAISRGKVEVFVTVDPVEGAQTEIRLNRRLARGYADALRELKESCGLAGEPAVSDLARFSDVFTVLKAPDDEERVWNAVRQVAEQAAAGFVGMRALEGERLRDDIIARAESIGVTVEEVERRSPETVREYREKLLAKMNEVLAGAKLDEARILTEAAIYADKVSVDEETVRLRSHLQQFALLMDADEPVGRKLDFLMQEMNREANTIASKASDIAIARMAVDIKAELEKIREQIQNIE